MFAGAHAVSLRKVQPLADLEAQRLTAGAMTCSFAARGIGEPHRVASGLTHGSPSTRRRSAARTPQAAGHPPGAA